MEIVDLKFRMLNKEKIKIAENSLKIYHKNKNLENSLKINQKIEIEL